jgi:hypothetical protein
VRVIQGCEQTPLTAKSCTKVIITCMQDLERTHTAQVALGDPVDRRRATSGDHSVDPIPPADHGTYAQKMR